MDSIDYKKLYELQDEVLDDFNKNFPKIIDEIAQRSMNIALIGK